MIEKYKQDQKFIITLLDNELKNDKIVQAYMFCCNDIDYIFNFSKEFSKELICKNINEDIKNNICSKIDKNIYDELKIIEPENNMIKKEQFLKLKEEISTKPIEGNKIVYIVKNCEKLNVITANAMLKFIEDANEDVIAIFLTDNLDFVIPTIKSRCQILNFKNVSNLETFYDYIFKKSMYDDMENLKKLVDNVIDFIKEFEKIGKNVYYKTKLLIYDVYTDNKEIEIFFYTLLYFYYDMFNYKITKKIKYMKEYEKSIINLSENNSMEKIIKKIYIIEELKKENTFNLNQKLLIDRLILKLCEV